MSVQVELALPVRDADPGNATRKIKDKLDEAGVEHHILGAGHSPFGALVQAAFVRAGHDVEEAIKAVTRELEDHGVEVAGNLGSGDLEHGFTSVHETQPEAQAPDGVVTSAPIVRQDPEGYPEADGPGGPTVTDDATSDELVPDQATGGNGPDGAPEGERGQTEADLADPDRAKAEGLKA